MGVLGTITGAAGVMFKSGSAWQRVEDKMTLHGTKMDHLNEKIVLVCDELARRITVLENRVQFDGYYIKRQVAPLHTLNASNIPGED